MASCQDTQCWLCVYLPGRATALIVSIGETKGFGAVPLSYISCFLRKENLAGLEKFGFPWM